jgi:hypothetical protein
VLRGAASRPGTAATSGRRRRVRPGQLERDGQAAAGRVVQGDRTALGLDQRPCDREAQARAAALPRPRGVGPEEPPEGQVPLLRGEPRPVVGDLDDHAPPVGPPPNLRGAPRVGRHVLEQGVQHGLQRHRVGVGRHRGRPGHLHAHGMCGARPADGRETGPADVERGCRQVEVAVLRAGQLQQTVDERGQIVDLVQHLRAERRPLLRQDLDPLPDERERRPQLVRGVRGERGLRSVGPPHRPERAPGQQPPGQGARGDGDDAAEQQEQPDPMPQQILGRQRPRGHHQADQSASGHHRPGHRSDGLAADPDVEKTRPPGPEPGGHRLVAVHGPAARFEHRDADGRAGRQVGVGGIGERPQLDQAVGLLGGRLHDVASGRPVQLPRQQGLPQPAEAHQDQQDHPAVR